MRSFKTSALFGVVLALVSSIAAAQDYPSRPIKVIVPYPAGGPADIIARTVTQKMQEKLGQPVVIDNRGGAGGMTGVDAVAKADPDGYTLGIGNAGPLSITASIPQVVVPYDPAKDLAAVALFVRVPEIVVVSPKLPVKTLPELIAYAKANPGKLNFASTGTGGLTHLAAEMLKIKAGIDMVHVPYRGAAPAITDLLGNQVQLMFADMPVLLPQIQAGALIPLGIASGARSPSAPNVATMTELGFPDVEADNWYGLIAPAKTPPAIIAKLNSIANEALLSADVKEKLAAQGANVAPGSPDDYRKLIDSETVKWAGIVKAAGVKGE